MDKLYNTNFNGMAENRGTYIPVDRAHNFCDRLFKSYKYSRKKNLKSNSPNLMQAGLSQMIIPIKLDSSTLKERGMAR